MTAMPAMMECSPDSDELFDTNSALSSRKSPPLPHSIAFPKTQGDVEGKLLFVPSTTILKEDGTPQDLLLIGYGTFYRKERELFALSLVGNFMGGSRTQYYYLDDDEEHSYTVYDKVEKWLPGFWKAQVKNRIFDERKTRAQRILSLFQNKETLEEAMSTIFNPANRVTNKKLAREKDGHDDGISKHTERLADEGDFNSLFDESEAESGDAVSALHEFSNSKQDSPEIVSTLYLAHMSAGPSHVIGSR